MIYGPLKIVFIDIFGKYKDLDMYSLTHFADLNMFVYLPLPL